MDIYYVDEQMLGDEATVEDAERMVELLTEWGYTVEYGHSIDQDEREIKQKDWNDALNIISQERYKF